ncbi:MAG: hypothetical protein WAS21_07815 [Geminicoccaceae bacterium]
MTKSGVATRPAGSDSYPPPAGTRVAWSLTQPIQDLLDQGTAAGIENLGTIGNTAHLQRHGDHTPWSAGKVRGKIYAKDSHAPADFEAWLVDKCRSSYDTSWIDFFNINNKQYDNAGRYLGRNDDVHLHISVRKGFENTHVTLFTDYANRTGEETDDMDGSTPITQATDVAIGTIPGGTITRPFNWWLSAIYAHIIGLEGLVRTTADAVTSIDGVDDQTKAQVEAARQGLADIRSTLMSATPPTV